MTARAPRPCESGRGWNRRDSAGQLTWLIAQHPKLEDGQLSLAIDFATKELAGTTPAGLYRGDRSSAQNARQTSQDHKARKIQTEKK
jgi:hypothetical protein